MKNTGKTKNYFGFSMIEMVVALGIFAISAATFSPAIIGSFYSLVREEQYIQAQAFAQEAVAALRAIRNRDWNEFQYSRSAITVVGNEWVFAGENTTEQAGKYTRIVDFVTVYRDGSGNIVTVGSPGASVDASSTLATVSISWEIYPSRTTEITRSFYLVDRN